MKISNNMAGWMALTFDAIRYTMHKLHDPDPERVSTYLWSLGYQLSSLWSGKEQYLKGPQAQWKSLYNSGSELEVRAVPEGTKEFVEYITKTLVPDLRESGSEATADDFQALVDIIRGESIAWHWRKDNEG